MRFKLTFKTPDIVDNKIEDFVVNSFDLNDYCTSNDPEGDIAEDMQNLEDELDQFMDKWTKNRENITIEFDTERGTATVVNQNI